MKQWKRVNYEEALDEFRRLKDDGHNVIKLTDWQWQIDGINFWPSCKKVMRKGKVIKYNQIRDLIT